MSSRVARTISAVLVVAVAACARVAPETTVAGNPVLTVVAWNMHGEAGDLPRLLDDLGAPRLSPAGDYVLLLQEAPDAHGRDVRAIAAARRLTAAFQRTPEREIGNAILSTLPLDSARALELPRERQPRRALMAGVDAGGIPLFVISTHLENRLGWTRGFFGDRARARQADALLRQLPGGHGILGGDMNTMLGPDERAWRLFLQRFPDTPPHPEPTFRDRLVLDHLFFDLPDGWTVARSVLADTYGSDHHPVVAVVSRNE
jgi:endonuclease/exonuclease/phosphatase family metal-dependent hydrolase